jgi:hypothetical protein
MAAPQAGAVAVLPIQAGASCFMTGLIWTMQLLNYPLLALIDPADVPRYEQAHNRRFIWLVGPASQSRSPARQSCWPGGPAASRLLSRSPRSPSLPSSSPPQPATERRLMPAGTAVRPRGPRPARAHELDPDRRLVRTRHPGPDRQLPGARSRLSAHPGLNVLPVAGVAKLTDALLKEGLPGCGSGKSNARRKTVIASPVRPVIRKSSARAMWNCGHLARRVTRVRKRALAMARAARRQAYRASGSPGWSTRTSAPGASCLAAETNRAGSRSLLVISLSPIRPLVKA